jgi:large subunit ribosomal protein L4
MASVNVVNGNREVVGTLELSDELFGEVGSTHVVWEVVRHHLAAQRSGTAAVKDRGAVSGGGKKPWRQKGTGRARVGSSRNPLWRHGGTIQGPEPRDYDHPMPRRKRRVAVRRVIASMLQSKRVTVVDQLGLKEPRTKAFKGLLGGFGDRALVLVTAADDSLVRASRNLSEYKVVEPQAINAYDLLKYRQLVATRDAMDRLQEILQR